MKSLFILLAVCGSIAAVSVLKISAGKDGQLDTCKPTTPCQWIPYDPKTKMEIGPIPNMFCKCASHMTCQRVENDEPSYTYVYFCKPAPAH